MNYKNIQEERKKSVKKEDQVISSSQRINKNMKNSFSKNIYKFPMERGIDMNHVIQDLITEKELLSKYQSMLKKSIKHSKEGTLRIVDRKTNVQYYHRIDKKNSNGKYIPKKKLDIAISLAQKEYDKKLLSELEEESKCIDWFLKNYHPENVNQIYDNLSDLRKELVISDQDERKHFIRFWLETPYVHLRFKETDPEYYTELGERVRSKSEMMIGNQLLLAGVPYRYEYPVRLFLSGSEKQVNQLLLSGSENKRGQFDISEKRIQVNQQEYSGISRQSDQSVLVHPDFMCLNPKTLEVVIWEHFGRMADPEYASKTVRKIALYEKNGFELGRNFLATFESSDKELNVLQVKKMIKRHFLE